MESFVLATNADLKSSSGMKCEAHEKAKKKFRWYIGKRKKVHSDAYLLENVRSLRHTRLHSHFQSSSLVLRCRKSAECIFFSAHSARALSLAVARIYEKFTNSPPRHPPMSPESVGIAVVC